MVRTLPCLGAILIAVVGFAVGPVAVNAAEIDVSVTFAEKLKVHVDRLNVLEKKREIYFRKHRGERRHGPPPRLARSRYGKIEYGVERLIPDVKDFSIENVIRRAVQRNLGLMELKNTPVRVTVHIKEMVIQNSPLARLSSFNTYMKGKVELFDSKGMSLGAVDITRNLFNNRSVDRYYNGPEYAFLAESAMVRTAPIALEFVEKALERLYKNKDVPGVIFIS